MSEKHNLTGLISGSISRVNIYAGGREPESIFSWEEVLRILKFEGQFQQPLRSILTGDGYTFLIHSNIGEILDASEISGTSRSDIFGGKGNTFIYFSATTSVTTGDGGDKILGVSGDQTTDSQILSSLNILNGNYGLLFRGSTQSPSNHLDTGRGNDLIVGAAVTESGALYNHGIFGFGTSIITGEGNDTIFGSSIASNDNDPVYAIGVHFNFLSNIDLGAGDDYLIGKSENLLSAQTIGVNIRAGSVVQMGSGNDLVIGDASVCKLGSLSGVAPAVWGVSGGTPGLSQGPGRILMGEGDDCVIASSFVDGHVRPSIGYLHLDLGAGDDYVRGLGPGNLFYGGDGIDLIDLSDFDASRIYFRYDSESGATILSYQVDPHTLYETKTFSMEFIKITEGTLALDDFVEYDLLNKSPLNIIGIYSEIY